MSTTTTRTCTPVQKNYPLKKIVEDDKKHEPFKVDIVWRNVIIFLLLHGGGLFGLYLMLTGRVHLKTFVFAYWYGFSTGWAITGGAHRLWAHRSYKATTALKLLLAYFQTGAIQNSIYEWCRDHRVHHKFSETDADPHNVNRGFFFAHIGWLLVRKHPDVKEKGKLVDMSDLEKDPIVMFQKRHYVPLVILIGVVVPVVIPWIFFNEPFWISWFVCGHYRYMMSLHMTWLVNSVAHMWGNKPYDKNISPVQNMMVSVITSGEGWHNYHHTFPWDYRASELGPYTTNLTTAIIDFFASIGWAYDLRTVPREMIIRRAIRTGDGSPVWGWGDKDIPREHLEVTQIVGKKE